MRHSLMLAAPLTTVVLLTACASSERQDANPKSGWSDNSGHNVSFVTVEPGVRLEVLDWGGVGGTLLLLTGNGDNAHVYDHFAHQFTDRFRVIAITRRGFGASSQPPQGYDVPTRAADDIKVLDALKVAKAVVAGHSIAGDELSELAGVYSDRVERLVYLDSVDYGKFAAVFKTTPLPAFPPLTEADTESVERYVAAQTRYMGVRFPEAAIRNSIKTDAAGRYVADITPDEIPEKITESSKQADYSRITAPTLAIWNVWTPESRYPFFWYLDSAKQEEYDRWHANVLVWMNDARQRFRSGLKNARIVELQGSDHYVFIRDEPAVVRAMRAFLLEQ